jgi:hypothetical protein
MPVILALRRLKQKDLEFEASLDYLASSRIPWITWRDLVSKTKQNKTKYNI